MSRPTRGAPDVPPKLPSLMPFLAIAGVLLVVYAGVLLFPRMEGWMSNQRCIASGHTNCAGTP